MTAIMIGILPILILISLLSLAIIAVDQKKEKKMYQLEMDQFRREMEKLKKQAHIAEFNAKVASNMVNVAGGEIYKFRNNITFVESAIRKSVRKKKIRSKKRKK